MLRMYAAIWHVSWRQQLVLITLSLAVAAIAAAPLKLQQDIINHLVAGGGKEILVWLALGYLGVIVASAALKFAQAFLMSRLGEDIVRRLRTRLYRAAVGQTGAEDRLASKRGTLVNMLSSEAEGVGSFVGAAISTPVMQIGIFVSVITFIVANQPELGLIVAFTILPQVFIVTLAQRRINDRVRERTTLLRGASDTISASEMQAVSDEVVRNFDDIYEIRLGIYRLRLTSKLLQGVIFGMGNAAILLVGGLLVLDGKADTGTLVASLSGLARLNGPWRELVGVYRTASVVHVNYEMILRQVPEIAPPGRPRPVEPAEAG